MVFSPKDKKELREAIEIYCKNRDEGVERYNEINS